MKEVTYVFSGGRKTKIEQDLIESKEFYYGVPYLLSENYNVEVIEFTSSNNKFFKFIDLIMTRVFSLPFSTSNVISIKNLRKVYNSKNIVLVNENTAFSVLPLILLTKLSKKINVSIFVMGLYSKNLRFSYIAPIHRLFIKLLIFFMDNVFILGKGELEVAKSFHKNHSKLIFFPFSTDEKFWKGPKLELGNNSDLIFIGNDGNRDPNIIVELSDYFTNLNFEVVSKLSEFNSPKENLNLNKGSWRTGELNDVDIKRIYKKARLSLIPLKQSTQPSGQSVALQSMAVGVPVVITKTNGFWDEDIFIDGHNIFFVNGFKKKDWIEKIKEIYSDINLLTKVSENASQTIEQHYKLSIFNEKLSKYIL